MKKALFSCLMVIGLMASCTSQQENVQQETEEADSPSMVLEGDSTVYGLACDGCTDTILVFLPIKNIQADPDTFNILNASRRRRVLGELNIGDKIAIVRNVNDSTVADFVINIENLENTWCYQVLPTLHERADMVGKTEKQKIENLPDTVQKLLAVSREYSMGLKVDHTVTSRGENGFHAENHPLVDYPHIKRYGQWHLFNGRLLLTEMEYDSLGNSKAIQTDTADFLMMNRDTLILRFQDKEHHYYPKREKVVQTEKRENV